MEDCDHDSRTPPLATYCGPCQRCSIYDTIHRGAWRSWQVLPSVCPYSKRNGQNVILGDEKRLHTTLCITPRLGRADNYELCSVISFGVDRGAGLIGYKLLPQSAVPFWYPRCTCVRLSAACGGCSKVQVHSFVRGNHFP